MRNFHVDAPANVGFRPCFFCAGVPSSHFLHAGAPSSSRPWRSDEGTILDHQKRRNTLKIGSEGYRDDASPFIGVTE
jgi:hypothetical protein